MQSIEECGLKGTPDLSGRKRSRYRHLLSVGEVQNRGAFGVEGDVAEAVRSRKHRPATSITSRLAIRESGRFLQIDKMGACATTNLQLNRNLPEPPDGITGSSPFSQPRRKNVEMAARSSVGEGGLRTVPRSA